MTTMLIGPIKGLGISVMWFWILLEGTLLIRDDISAVSLQHVNFLLASLHASNMHLDPFMSLLACQVCVIRIVSN